MIRKYLGNFYDKESIVNNDLKNIAKRIKELMEKKGLKQVDIVKAIGISKGSVSKWLSGKAKPSGEYLLRLSEVLKTTEYWILNGKHPPTSYREIDDGMFYSEYYEESQRDYYIAELGFDPSIPYSISFLRDEFEKKIFSRFAEYDQATPEQEENFKEHYLWLESERLTENSFENMFVLGWLEEYTTKADLEENFIYDDRALRSQSEIALRANANLCKTLFYNQEDHSMEPIITIGAQCAVDLTHRIIKNGKFYLVKRAKFHGIRALFIQSDGSLVLKCNNKEYPDEKIFKSELSSLSILGYVYSWTNISPLYR